MSLAWRVEWDRLSRRISGFVEAGQIYLNGLSEGKASHGSEVLTESSQAIVKGLENFLARHRTTLPQQASQSLGRFLSHAWPGSEPDAWNLYPLRERIIALASIHPELEFYFADFELFARRLSERAFSHLRRSIIVDEETRWKWQRAYGENEPACERLGAVHLLLHGIWAFKAYSPGERTDLVLGDKLSNLTEVERAADALVLTEWKRVTRESSLTASAESALSQAARYASGSLSGIELHNHRYLVLVSENALDVPPDRTENGITYRYVNIPVDPLPPSRAGVARNRGRSSQAHNQGPQADG